jgi:hypothetical protein
MKRVKHHPLVFAEKSFFKLRVESAKALFLVKSLESAVFTV